MATSKKRTPGKAAGAGARNGQAKARDAVQKAKTQPSARGAAAPRKPGPVKLNDRQRDFLTRIHGAGATGFEVARTADQRTVDALVDRKLVKKGAKNKATGKPTFLLTRAGEKHLPAAPAPEVTSASAPLAPPEPAAVEPAPAPTA
jgi:hypothetical protein